MRRAEGYFNGVENLKLYWQAWTPAEAKANILIFHGFGEHSGRYINLVSTLVPQGYALWTFDQHGHGRSPGKRGVIRSFSDYVENGTRFAQQVIPQDLPLLVLGHSMGSIIAMNWLEHWPQVKGAILSGTGQRLARGEGFQYKVLEILNRLVPNLVLKFPLPTEFISRDPQVVAGYDADPLTHGRISVRLAVEMKRALATGRTKISGAKIPILVQCGTQDCSFCCQEELFHGLTTPDKTIFLYQGLRHEVYNELEADRELVLRDLSNWLLPRI